MSKSKQTKMITLRLSVEDYRVVVIKAAQAKSSLNSYLKHLALGTPIPVLGKIRGRKPNTQTQENDNELPAS